MHLNPSHCSAPRTTHATLSQPASPRQAFGIDQLAQPAGTGFNAGPVCKKDEPLTLQCPIHDLKASCGRFRRSHFALLSEGTENDVRGSHTTPRQIP